MSVFRVVIWSVSVSSYLSLAARNFKQKTVSYQVTYQSKKKNKVCDKGQFS